MVSGIGKYKYFHYLTLHFSAISGGGLVKILQREKEHLIPSLQGTESPAKNLGGAMMWCYTSISAWILFICLSFNVTFNTLFRSYHDG